nr:MAG TPA: tail completion protein [Caudoviricetes sp.]
MTPLELQKSLCREIEEISKDIILYGKDGTVKKLKAFPQRLPLKSKEDTESKYPFCIVRLENGKKASDDSAYEVTTHLIIGIHHDNRDAQGHQELMIIINRILERFFKNNVLANQYVMIDNFEWAIEDDDGSHPYYVGGIALTWIVPSIVKEDVYS